MSSPITTEHVQRVRQQAIERMFQRKSRPWSWLAIAVIFAVTVAWYLLTRR